MMYKFTADEWYPVYEYITDEQAAKMPYVVDGEVELTEEELKEFLECARKFHGWQQRLRYKIREY